MDKTEKSKWLGTNQTGGIKDISAFLSIFGTIRLRFRLKHNGWGYLKVCGVSNFFEYIVSFGNLIFPVHCIYAIYVVMVVISSY